MTPSLLSSPPPSVRLDTEDAVALAFEQTFSDCYRFNATRAQWLAWNGSIWEPDETGRAFDAMREFCRTHGGPRFQTAARVKAVETFCRNSRGYALTHAELDADLHLLGTPGGTVDLHTGCLRPSVPGDLITRSTIVTPTSGSPSRWLEFLAEVTDADAEFIRFLRQVAGYALTGVVSGQCLFFFFGDGGTGKSTFVNTLQRVMGTYSRAAPMDAFVAATVDKHPTDLAMLAGARLVTANETEPGRKWATARIKSLSGGDPITARFMRQNFFTYQPTFKLVFVGNVAPSLEVVDEALRRRFHVVPFDQKPKVRDDALAEKLIAEAPQILAWMIEGCLDWRQNGLIVPPRVAEATGIYFAEQDLFKSWLEDRVDRNPKGSTPKASALASWNNYRLAAGERVEGFRDLAHRCRRAGFVEGRAPKSEGPRERVWLGMELRSH